MMTCSQELLGPFEWARQQKKKKIIIKKRQKNSNLDCGQKVWNCSQLTMLAEDKDFVTKVQLFEDNTCGWLLPTCTK